MQISWKGQACFVLTETRGKEGQVQVVADPFDASSGLKLSSLSADVVLFSNGEQIKSQLTPITGTPFVIANPGEYEVKGVVVQGIQAASASEAKKSVKTEQSTIYVIVMDGIRICHLGVLRQENLTSEQLEAIGSVDVLLVPVGNGETISAQTAAEIVSQIEPRIVVPMYYALPKLKQKLDDVKQFLKVMGKPETVPQNKLNIRAKDIPMEGETQIVVLSP